METYTVGGPPVEVEVSPDIHICGFCKQEFTNYAVFLAHKQHGCSLPASDPSGPAAADSRAEFVFEETYQTCVMRGVKKILTKAQKTPSKKLKPGLTSKRHSCCFSGCTFKTQYGQKDMERHLKTHTGEKPFECELCHKRFSRRDKLNMHSRSHTGEKPHKCKLCPYAAADSSSLKKHLRIHYDERPFKCQICPYASRNSSQLTVHLRSHTGDAPFQCQQCDAKFKINSDLKRHVRIHSGEKPYKCDHCEYRCAMKGNLKSHVQIKHATHDSFRCPHCDFCCANRAALRQHTREHRPAQPIRCAACSYSCSSRGALRVHERIHSEERPFSCDACSFASKQRSNLLIHRKKFHSDRPEKGGGAGGGGGGAGGGGGGAGSVGGGDSPKPVSSRYRAKLDAARAFSCDSCSASFVREDSLRSHRKQHRDAQNLLRLQLAAAPDDTGPPPPPQEVPTATDAMTPYGSAQLKIIVSHPLGQENPLVSNAAAAAVEAQNKMVLLSPENQDLVVNSMMQQVNLEPQTVLLTQLGAVVTDTDDGGVDPLHQALLQTAITAQEPSAGTPTFITTCSELEGLNALIQEGGTEVTVVTEGNVAMATADAAEAASKPAEDGAFGLGGQGVVLHAVPALLVAAQTPTLSPHALYGDTNTLDGAQH